MSEALPTGTWIVQAEGSRVGFRVKHLGISSAEGDFESFAGAIEVSPDAVTARGTVRVDSIRTGDGQRDSLLASRLFFDAEHHPDIEFASTAVEQLGRGRLWIEGPLTISGSSRPVRLEAQASEQDGGGLRLKVTGELSRSDYGLRFRGPMSAGNRAVGDRVSIELDLLAAPRA